MWKQVKDEVTDLFSNLSVVSYFKNLERRLYQVELMLYKTYLKEIIDNTIEFFETLNNQEKYKKTTVYDKKITLDKKYEKDFGYLCTIMEVCYKHNNKITIGIEYKGYGIASLTLVYNTNPQPMKKPIKKKMTPGRRVKNFVGIVVCIILLGLVSCTDAKMKQLTTIGNPGKIRCYSGGVIIYEGESTGKIATENQSDGWYFEEKGTGNLVRVSGDCVIRN